MSQRHLDLPPQDLPKTDVDSFQTYRWEMSTAIRPLWGHRNEMPYKVHLRREAYFGRIALAEPVRGKRTGPPFTVQTMPSDTAIPYSTQEEVSLCFSREEAVRAVRRYEAARIKEETEPTLFEARPFAS
jgi:hypothetical protein